MTKVLKSIAFSFGVHMCLEKIWLVLQGIQSLASFAHLFSEILQKWVLTLTLKNYLRSLL